MGYKETLQTYCRATEAYLDSRFREELPQKLLFEAMRYSLMAGGKRIRPALALEFCRISGGNWEEKIPFAAAVEMVHTYSLIHDDLPCMDNDDYRRGRLTNHKVYGEAVAVLAGDGLLTAAFDTLSHAQADPSSTLKAVQILSRAAGELGMVGGQVLDMDGESRTLTADEVHTIHKLKTGCLISAACQVGVAAANGTEEQMKAAGDYAAALGLAFQIRDDMLDVLGDEKKLGKKTNMDENKTTFVTLYGIDACASMIAEETEKAKAALTVFEDRAFLSELAEQMAVRDY